MLMRRKIILAATTAALALPAAPAMADGGPSNSASANATNVSYTTQNAAQVGGYYSGDQILVQSAETNQYANAEANALQVIFPPYKY